jgi:pimeloyl-ACP methyl ester carboxylesterase
MIEARGYHAATIVLQEPPRHERAGNRPLAGQSDLPMSRVVSRHFVCLDARQVHYRRAGHGPPVLLLHQTPTSSAELLPLIEALAPFYTVLAPDMPGYGASDPLPVGEMTVQSLADGVAAFMARLGIAAAAVYGYHTGASIATCLARRHPERVIVAICEGLLCLDAQEREEFLARYAEPFVPRWDGAHLAWLWSRLRDQSIFFPWYERSAAARLAIDGTPHSVLALMALDWLRSGERYPQAYAAAFAYDPLPDLAAISCPHFIVAQQGDPLSAHLARLPSMRGQLQTQLFAGVRDGIDRVLSILAATAARAAAPAPVAAQPQQTDSRLWQDYLSCEGLQLRVMQGPGSAPLATVVLHDAQGSLRSCTTLLNERAAGARVLAVELPGHGESDGIDADGEVPIPYLAELLHAVLLQLGLPACHLIGMGAGAAIAVQMLQDRPALASALTLIAPIDLTAQRELQNSLRESYLAPRSDFFGGYLLRAWHEVRDHLLFFPWFERRRAFAAANPPRLDTALIHARTVDLLLAGASGAGLRRAEMCYPMLQRLQALRLPVDVAAPSWEPRYAHSRELAGTRWPFRALRAER